MEGRIRVRMLSRGGFTLIEALMAVTILGLSAMIALPLLKDLTVAQDVRSARAAVANTYARARVHAVQVRKPATVNFSASSVWITVPGDDGPAVVGTMTNLTQAYGVQVAATGNVTVQPTGLVNAALPITVRVSKGEVVDSVVISGYGRLQ
jgi:prepilin-type N-terminal cleavage/methylation domain-containing protein